MTNCHGYSHRERLLAQVPDYKVFLTVDELNASSQELVNRYPNVASLVRIGRAKDGEPISMLRIGHGKKQLLFIGCPHPNEPIGAMTLEYLAERLVEDDSLRGTEFTWNLIKCIDPNGTRLNEGWFSGPFTIKNYARHFYRPAAYDQAEWTFPIVYKKLVRLTPTPETQALMNAIAGLRPSFMYSLHNAGFGGAYYYLWPELPGVYEELLAVARVRRVPIALGEPEMPWAERYSDAVYRVPRVTDQYDFLESQGWRDPSQAITCGASSFEYAMSISNPAVLVCEVPYFYDPRIEDTTPSSLSRRDAILSGVAWSQDFCRRLEEAVAPLSRAGTLQRSSLGIAVTNLLQVIRASDEARATWARNASVTERPASVAEVFDSLYVARFYRLLVTGMAVRAVEAAGLARGEMSERTASEVMQRVSDLFEQLAAELDKSLNYTAIPIKNLVEIQLGALFVVLSYLP